MRQITIKRFNQWQKFENNLRAGNCYGNRGHPSREFNFNLDLLSNLKIVIGLCSQGLHKTFEMASKENICYISTASKILLQRQDQTFKAENETNISTGHNLVVSCRNQQLQIWCLCDKNTGHSPTLTVKTIDFFTLFLLLIIADKLFPL